MTTLPFRIEQTYPKLRGISSYGRGDFTHIPWYHHPDMPNGIGCGPNYTDYNSGDGPEHPNASEHDFYIFQSTIGLLCWVLEQR